MTARALLLLMGLCTALAGVQAQPLTLLRPRDVARWGVPRGNYSGITPLGDGRYAVVSDKEERDGFYVWHIQQDPQSGQVTRVTCEGFRGGVSAVSPAGGRDAEGVAFVPADSTVWISGEADQRVVAHRLDGQPAGRELTVPAAYGTAAIHGNYGFEALAYDAATGCLWTVTENVVRAVGHPVSPLHPTPREVQLLGFTLDGVLRHTIPYTLEAPVETRCGRHYGFGVVALWAAGGGTLWVLEREAMADSRPLRNRTHLRLFAIDLRRALAEGTPATKRSLLSFDTRMRLVRPRWANYEGLCQGQTLADGRRTWLMVCDSQNRKGRRWCHLHDLLRVVVEGHDN